MPIASLISAIAWYQHRVLIKGHSVLLAPGQAGGEPATNPAILHRTRRADAVWHSAD
jgi:hypothetical protein